MAMRDLVDNALDDAISAALQHETIITPARKARAWEQTRRRAAGQVMLPPDLAFDGARRYAVNVIPSANTSLLDRCAGWLRHAARWFLDERGFERARQHNVRAYQFSDRRDYVYSTFSLSS